MIPDGGRQRRGGRRVGFAIAASALLHVVPLLLLFKVAPALRTPSYGPQSVVQLDLRSLPVTSGMSVRRLPPTAVPASLSTTMAARRREPARRVQPETALATALGATALGAAAPSSAQASTPTSTQAVGQSGVGGSGADGRVVAALRGMVGCSQDRLLHLSDAEREACDRRRDHQAAVGASMPVDSVPMEKRVYFDAVKQAYDAVRDPRTPVPTGVGGQGWRMGGHPPGLGCKFGGRNPPNSLKLGPCFISPPQGVLTEESAVQRPY
jgi:hypothetical protein